MRVTRSPVSRPLVLVLLGAQFLVAADFSVLTVALPAVVADLGLDVGTMSWVNAAYALPAAGLSVLFGRLADVVGRRRVFVAGLALLTAASLAGGFAGSAGVLVAARAAQGVGTALAAPAGLALLTDLFPAGPRRDRALGLNGALIGGGFTAGAVAGGLLAEFAGWRWTFFAGVPAGAVLLIGAFALVRSGAPPARRRLDVPGAVVVTAGLPAVVHAVTTADRTGWSSAVLPGVVGVLCLVAFPYVERRSADPLVPVRLLRAPAVQAANVAGFAVVACATAMSLSSTLHLQRVQGLSALATGLLLAGAGTSLVLGGLLAPRAMARVGAHRVLVWSVAAQAVAFGSLALVPGSALGVAHTTAAMAVAFLAHAHSLVAYLVIGTTGVPDGDHGAATGLTSMSLQTGSALGIPVFAGVAAAWGATASAPPAAVLAGGRVGALAVGAALVVVTMFVHLRLKREGSPA